MKMRNFLVVMMILIACPFAAHAELERTVWACDTRTPDKGNVVAGLWFYYMRGFWNVSSR